MIRNVVLEDISDGKLYTANDMVRTGCGGCQGCSVCCHQVGNTIILDPADIYHLNAGMGRNFEQLLAAGKLELNVVDGIVLPNLTVHENAGCGFLDGEGRCLVHSFRPGLCRLFPLGRYYTDGTFRYILQVHECPYPAKTKVKVKQWLGIENLERYEEYISQWHYYLLALQQKVRDAESAAAKQVSMALLNTFFVKPYRLDIGFYEQFEERMHNAVGI